MPFRIRTKLIIAFFVVIFPFIIIVGAITLYNTNAIRKASLKVEAISEELHLMLSLELAMHKALMPGNDYIITGDKKYRDEFNKASKEVEGLLKDVEKILIALKGMEASEIEKEKEMEIFNFVKTAWVNIKKISEKIFAIWDPMGDKEAARLMEEMDYTWAYPAIQLLDKHHEIDRKEHVEVMEDLNKVWRMAWVIMISGAVILISSGVFFAVFYSRLFAMPINTIHSGADAIAGGDFKTRLNIKTGDEIEQLSNSMNEMAAQLDSFYSNLQDMVDERTRELKESEERFHSLAQSATDAIVMMDDARKISFWNDAAERMFHYTKEEAVGSELHKLIVPEKFYDDFLKGFERFKQTGEGAVIGKTHELGAVRKDGTELVAEHSISAVKIKGKWHAIGIIRDITERKRAEEKIKEQMDYLVRFEKATIQREFRVKELRDRVKELEEDLGKTKG